jgi:hypothetical protein
MARQADNPVMLSAAKYLHAQRDRPFAAAQGDIRGERQADNPVMLSAAKYLHAQRDRPFAAAQGDKKGPAALALWNPVPLCSEELALCPKL